MRAVAINVGANTNEPGFRGPVRPDGSFEYVPIPETEPADAPTYGDIAPHLETPIPDTLRDQPVHLDPEFSEYPCCERYTYGDDHAVRAGPLSELSAGDYVFFYATLTVTRSGQSGSEAGPNWLPPEWGAFLIGHFRLERDAVTGEAYTALDADDRMPFANNAHVRRETRPSGESRTGERGGTACEQRGLSGAKTSKSERGGTTREQRQAVDARVLLLGDPERSQLYDRCVPLSRPTGGSDASSLVTRLSADSGRGPWWRRPLRYADTESRRLLALVDSFQRGLEDYQP